MNKKIKILTIIIIICVIVVFGIFTNHVVELGRKRDAFVDKLTSMGITVLEGVKNSHSTVFTVYVEKAEFFELAKERGVVYQTNSAFYVFSEDHQIAYHWKIT